MRASAGRAGSAHRQSSDIGRFLGGVVCVPYGPWPWIATWNADSKPFVWTKTADEVLAVRPAVEGTAKSFGGRLLGGLLNLFGTIVLLMSLFSWAYG